MADAFTSIVPAATFSPAELQQHLLIHRVAPQKAIDEASKMVERRRVSDFTRATPDTHINAVTQAEPQLHERGTFQLNPSHTFSDFKYVDQGWETVGRGGRPVKHRS